MYPENNFSYIQWEKFSKIADEIFGEIIKNQATKLLLQEFKLQKESLNTGKNKFLLKAFN